MEEAVDIAQEILSLDYEIISAKLEARIRDFLALFCDTEPPKELLNAYILTWWRDYVKWN